MGDRALGLIYPPSQRHRPFTHSTLVQRAQAMAATRDIDHLAEAARDVPADLRRRLTAASG